MQKFIQFILNGKTVTLGFNRSSKLTPTVTLLNFLRSHENRKGVKEGCAQGDCGACTVVIAEPGTDGSLIYKTVDSCLLLLPMVHGKQVITIEDLAIPGPPVTELHPVQKALFEYHGTQCGFCTPGMVMSLFGLFKNHVNPSSETIDDALTGNLCRCTGYKSIVEAARSACSHGGRDHFSLTEEATTATLRKIVESRESLELIAEGQIYLKPFVLQEAFGFLNKYPGAVVINGATDVALRQNKKGETLKEILDLSSINELQFFREEEELYRIGSGLTLEALRIASEDKLPALYKMLKVFGSLQIRNLATLGGNVASASPIGDTIPLLMAYRASLCLTTGTTKRKIKIEQFLKGYHETDLKPLELITEIEIPKPDADTKIASYKVSKRKDLDISTVSAAFSLKLKNLLVSDIILAYGGMAQVTKRATLTELFLTGKKWSKPIVEEAMQILDREMTPISDARAGAIFRKTVAKNLLLKFYLDNKIPDNG